MTAGAPPLPTKGGGGGGGYCIDKELLRLQNEDIG